MTRRRAPSRLALALCTCAAVGLWAAGCGPEVPIRPARVVRTWAPSPVSSGVASVDSRRALFDLSRGSRYNLLEYRDERLHAADKKQVTPLYQVGVGFPVRDWVTGYFLPTGEYIMGEEWDRNRFSAHD